jgi:hypothetical protein
MPGEQYGSIIFHCDGDHCGEEEDTGYTTWDYGLAYIKRVGWYVMKDEHHLTNQGWVHLCPSCGKAAWISRKRAEEAEAAQRRQAEVQRTGKLFGHLKDD